MVCAGTGLRVAADAQVVSRTRITMISTRDLGALPDIQGFRKLTQALAMLDAILSPEWQTDTTPSTRDGRPT